TRSERNADRFVAWICGERRMVDGSFMCAPIDGRSGPVGAHPRKDGALLERWRAQCGVTRLSIQESTRSRIWLADPSPRRILNLSCFPEPCGHPGLQPSPKHASGGPVKESLSTLVADRERPASCPVCQSS